MENDNDKDAQFALVLYWYDDNGKIISELEEPYETMEQVYLAIQSSDADSLYVKDINGNVKNKQDFIKAYNRDLKIKQEEADEERKTIRISDIANMYDNAKLRLVEKEGYRFYFQGISKKGDFITIGII